VGAGAANGPLQIVPRSRWEMDSCCSLCGKKLGKRFLRPRHHCRVCGRSVCARCSPGTLELERACTACVDREQSPKEETPKETCPEASTADSADAPTAEEEVSMLTPVPDQGAYLVFNPASHGQMNLVWSETKVTDALAFGSPRKKVPKFKFQGGGTTVLQKVESDNAKYFNGWGQFLKQCQAYDCSIIDFGITEPIPIAIWLHLPGGAVKKVGANDAFTLEGIDAIAVIPANNRDFEVATMESRLFVQKGQLAGWSDRLL